MNNSAAYLVDALRSPIGRGHREKGSFATLRADDLAAQVLKALVARTKLDPNSIDDIYVGCVGQHLEQGKNIARLIGLLAGLPITVPGITINRLCASSFSALAIASDAIKAGSNSLAIVGGVEHLGHVPMTASVDYNPMLFKDYEFAWNNMGLTAEKLAEDFKISRTEQDQFTVESNQRYFDSLKAGFYEQELIPIRLPSGETVTTDQEPRLSTIEKLAELKTVFKENGTVTAANSSGISDGAAMALVCSEEHLSQFDRPLARIEATSSLGLDPTVMGLGPVYAIQKLLEKTNLTIDQIDLFEINEAFAVQLLACQRELKISSDRLNIHGGAVAMGHPLGMSGLRIISTLAHSMTAQKAKYGIASMCVGHGQGVAMLLANPNN